MGAGAATTAKRARLVSAPFRSAILPYRLDLPAGWAVDPASQGAGSDSDEFVDAGRTRRLLVGHGFPTAHETVADRVRANRKDELRTPGCTPDKGADRPIRVAGEHGVLWGYTCTGDSRGLIPAADVAYLSAQTIHRRPGHRRVGYRFTVAVPLAARATARPLLDRLLAGLAFDEHSRVTADR